MNKIIRFIIISISVTIFSCNSSNLKDYDDDCTNFYCETNEPYYTDINIKFSRTTECPNPTIYIMLGHYGEGTIYKEISTDSLEDYIYDIDVEVSINAYYTIYTKYIVNNDTITAIDGDFVYKESYVECDYECWKIKNKHFNINLK
ncbi:MAG: hypothetical protein JXR68_08570 [Bacteroidales bacterium]|nr:hypothetical protein [Bacteroidales bacterium]